MDDIVVPDADLSRPGPGKDLLPESLLYGLAAPLGGPGLGATAIQTLRAGIEPGRIGRVYCYKNLQDEVPRGKIRDLSLSPVRLLANLDSAHYYGARQHWLDQRMARALGTGRFDCFHGWSNSCLRTLKVAAERGVPSLIEIPTWHRDKGKVKPRLTKSEREALELRGWARWRHELLVSRQQTLDEYELATLVLVQSEKAAETFVAAGCDPKKIFYVARGVSPERFRVATPPGHFRLTFVGALIKRKGVHLILEAWHRLGLKDAELVLVGHSHAEMQPYLDRFKTDTVTLAGRVSNVEDYLATSSAFVFPSECEGSAKATWEALAAGLPMISTREAGDATVDGVNGIVVPANDVDALAGAIEELYAHPERLGSMGRASRRRVEEGYTWAHFRRRIEWAWATARGR